MFGWIKDLFTRRGLGEDWFRPEERRIYKFFDGEKLRIVDPKPYAARINAKKAEISADYKVATMEVANEFVPKAEEQFYKNVRLVFDLPPLGPGGAVEYEKDGKVVKTLTEGECLDLFENFITYVEGLKKNSRTSSTSTVP